MGDTKKSGYAERLRQQTALARFRELALRSDDLEEILTEACRLAGEALGTDLAKVVELQEDGKTLVVRAGVGWKPGVISVATITAEHDTSEGHALRTGEPMISPDIATETRRGAITESCPADLIRLERMTSTLDDTFVQPGDGIER